MLNPDQQEAIALLRNTTYQTRRATVPALEQILYEAIPVLDHGFVRCVDYLGDDAAVVQAAKPSPKYLGHIERALQQGYRVDIERGIVFGKKGKPLSSKRGEKQKYATVPLVSYKDGDRLFMAVPVHKVVAFAKFGPIAFARGVHVRHRDNDRDNNCGINILLGSASDNERDKDPATRIKSAKAARSAQGKRPRNAKLQDDEVEEIRKALELNRNVNGRIRRGAVSHLSAQYGVSKTAISMIGKGQSYV